MNAEQIDAAIETYREAKQQAEAAASHQEKQKRRLVKLARQLGFRRRQAWLLKGARAEALIVRDLEIFIADQLRARKLPASYRRTYLVELFKPAEALRALVKDGGSAAGAPYLRTFIRRALKLRRHWRIARTEMK